MDKDQLLERTADLCDKYPQTPFMYVDYPHKTFWKPFGDRQVRGALTHLASIQPSTPLMLYVHMPYCQKQCYFCTCHVLISLDYDDVKRYLKIMYQELELLRRHLDKIGRELDVAEIHLGGGSPTFIKEKEFDEMLGKLGLIADLKKLDELAIEVDPRRIKKDRLLFYHDRGISRISFGVQDFDLDVQKAVNRVQPAELTARLLTPDVRKLFKNGINFDILCGLPMQTKESMRKTFEQVVELAPDRICLNYMDYAPKFHKHQLLMPQDRFPDMQEKKELFLEALDVLAKTDYVRTGYDHFAKPTDAVAKAMKEKRMNWNHLGYTPGRVVDVLGIGIGSASRLGANCFQNAYDIPDYQAALEKGQFPAFRGAELDADDLLRRDVIHRLRGFFRVDFAEIEKKHSIRFADYFAPELRRLESMARDGIVEIGADEIAIPELGYQFSNVVCSVFDKYIRQDSAPRRGLDAPPKKTAKR